MMTDNFHTAEEQWKRFWAQYPKEAACIGSFEDKIAYTFANKHLLYEAMTHRSALNTTLSLQGIAGTELPWNERLEFLGDSVLGLAISSMIWHQEFLDEGQLSQRKASLVSEASLAKLALELGLADCLTVGKVEKKTGNHLRPSLLANALEALIGAIYLDSNYASVEKVIQQWFGGFFASDDDFQNAKTRLQELIQAQHQQVPQYLTLEENGPDHSKTFKVAVVFNGKTLAEAEGTSKKRASQAAAKKVLDQWDVQTEKDGQLC